MDSIDIPHFLSGVLVGPRGGRLTTDTTYRRYRTAVRTSAMIGGIEDSRNTTIMTEIGRIDGRWQRLLASNGTSDYKVECAYPTNAIQAEEFLGLAKKFSNFSARFEYSSLAALAERIAKALAVHTTIEEVTSVRLRGGAPLVVAALGTYGGPVNSLTSTVFIPRLVNNVITGDVFSILANAAAAEGSSIATDVLELDANTRQPIIGDVDGDGFQRAAVEALRIIGANMAQSDQGPLFAYAVTKGIHKVVSVVGHTDEGGITRDLLRSGDFSTPFGGINYGLDSYTGLPGLQSMQPVQGAAFVDSIAMTTAAVTAHCDPGITYDGTWYPTVYNGVGPDTPTARPGDNLEGTDDMARRNRSQLLAEIEKFWRLYIPAVSRIFGLAGTSDLAVRVATTQAQYLRAVPRHLRYPSVAPWYWIEPTGLIPSGFVGSAAETGGSGSFGGKDTTTTKPAWESIELSGVRDNTMTAYVARFTSARRSWFLAHWLNHPLNGLGATRVRQMDPNSIIHPGPCPGNEQVRDRLEADLPLTSYLWTRGQSPFCAPGEMLNLAGTIGFLVRHLTFSDDGDITEEHLPTAREFIDTTVTIAVGRPVSLQPGNSNGWERDVRRARTRASVELSAASKRARAFGVAGVAEMATLATAPRVRTFAPDPNLDGNAPGGVPVVRNGSDAAGGGMDDSRRGPMGNPLTATPQHQPLRFPVLPRGALGGGGGGAIPPAGPGGPDGAPPGGPPPPTDPSDNQSDAPVNPPVAIPDLDAPEGGRPNE
jgi:hypothetical protein